MMFLLSEKTILTLQAVIDIACNARPDPARSAEVTARLGCPRRHLEKIMQQLARAGILKGVRGPRGGYMLARERRRISIGDIVRAAAAAEAGEKPRPPLSGCGMKLFAAVSAEAEEQFLARLDAVSLEDLCAQQAAAETPGAEVDFTI